MARRSTKTLPRPAETIAVPERISKKRFALWMPIVLMALLGLGTLIALAIVPDTAPAVQPFDSAQGEPEQQTGTGTGAEEIVPVDENPPRQSESSEPSTGAVAPAGWPVVQVEWQEAPFVFPAPRWPTLDTYDGDSRGMGPTPEKEALVHDILPSLPEERGLFVSASKDPAAPQYILVGIHIIDGTELHKALFEEDLSQEEVNSRGIGLELDNKLFLSRDGEGSWEEITLPAEVVILQAVTITALWNEAASEIVGLKMRITQDYSSGWQTILQP